MRTKAMGPQYGRDTSKAKTVGVNIALDKTFEKGLKVGEKNYFQGINVGFEGFVGRNKRKR